MTKKEIEVELKAIKIKLNEVYEWMELTQTDRIDKLTYQLIEMKEQLNKLEYGK